MVADETITTNSGGVSSVDPLFEINRVRQEQQSDKHLLLQVMSGIVIFVAITFTVEVVFLHMNYAQDKYLCTLNNEIVRDYTQSSVENIRTLNEIRTDFEILKARNSYLK